MVQIKSFIAFNFYLSFNLHFSGANSRYEVIEEQEFNSANNSLNNFKWMLMPGERNNLQAAILSDFQSTESSPNLESVKFYLYTR